MLLLVTGIALAYTPTEGIDFERITSPETFDFIGDTKLTISTYRAKESSYYDELFYKAIYSSTVVSLGKVQSLGVLNKKCSQNDLVEIYEISETSLNDPSRFPKEFIGGQGNGRGSLWGYFDPRISEPGYNSIVLSPHNESENYRILVHEIAHHWYATFCLDRYTNSTSEEFAVAVEQQATWE
jgi:hypothetical protein